MSSWKQKLLNKKEASEERDFTSNRSHITALQTDDWLRAANWKCKEIRETVDNSLVNNNNTKAIFGGGCFCVACWGLSGKLREKRPGQKWGGEKKCSCELQTLVLIPVKIGVKNLLLTRVKASCWPEEMTIQLPNLFQRQKQCTLKKMLWLNNKN